MRKFHLGVVQYFSQYVAAAYDEKGEAVEAQGEEGNDVAVHGDMSSPVAYHDNLHVVRALEVHNWMTITLDDDDNDLQRMVMVHATATFASAHDNLDQHMQEEDQRKKGADGTHAE